MTSATSLPTLFLSHGSPMLSVEPGIIGPAWLHLARHLPRPHAILMVSAHWLMPIPTVSATAKPETIHDFHGFPKPLYQIRYPAPGAPELAQRIKELIPEATIDSGYGLDHGAWVPLRYMYPAADIPVAQFAILPKATPEAHYALGVRLRPLRNEGVLIIGSGSITHNLRDTVRDAPDGAALPYVHEFCGWFHEKLESKNLPALFDYRRQAPHAVRAHPTDEHLLPLFVALGAASIDAPFVIGHQDVTLGALAMDGYQFG